MSPVSAVVLGLEPQTRVPVVQLQVERREMTKALNDAMPYINARARFQHVADEVAGLVPYGTLRELAFQLGILEEQGLSISVAVKAFQEANDKKAKGRL